MKYFKRAQRGEGEARGPTEPETLTRKVCNIFGGGKHFFLAMTLPPFSVASAAFGGDLIATRFWPD